MPLPPPAIDLLKLSLVAGLSPRTQRALVQRFGSAEAALGAAHEEVVAFAGSEAARALARGPEPRLVERTTAWCERAGHHLVAIDDAAYPALLREIADPPLVLYARGRLEVLASTCFAVVGSRNATSQGRHDARAFARTLSEAGLCVVSGLAHGIDAAAHRGGLEGRSASIAVTGTGIDVVYPDAHIELDRQLAESGCVLTEYSLGMPPRPGNFPRRNRLISGLSRGVLVVEANESSGSLITARSAADQGRDVYALPGSIHSTLSKGCHKIIREGAILVEKASDILVDLGMEVAVPVTAAARPEAHPLLEKMGFDPVSLDQMALRTGLGAAAISAQLSLLEIAGRIRALPGGRFQRVSGTA